MSKENMGRNAEHYADPTPTAAMRNICRDEYQKEAARLDRIGDIVPPVSYTHLLLDSVSGAFNDTTGLHRLRVTVEVEDLGADVKFGKPASETQHSPALQRLTAGKLIPAQDISPAAIDPAPEVVA